MPAARAPDRKGGMRVLRVDAEPVHAPAANERVDDRKKAVTIQSLLDMTSGFDWDQGIEDGKEQTLLDMTLSPNWTQFILDRPMAQAPGEVFD
jgi:CubicO group peptidase (beta-lactamase class C family)